MFSFHRSARQTLPSIPLIHLATIKPIINRSSQGGDGPRWSPDPKVDALIHKTPPSAAPSNIFPKNQAAQLMINQKMINTIHHRNIINIDIHIKEDRFLSNWNVKQPRIIKEISCIVVALFNPIVQLNFGGSTPMLNNSRVVAIQPILWKPLRLLLPATRTFEQFYQFAPKWNKEQ